MFRSVAAGVGSLFFSLSATPALADEIIPIQYSVCVVQMEEGRAKVLYDALGTSGGRKASLEIIAAPCVLDWESTDVEFTEQKPLAKQLTKGKEVLLGRSGKKYFLLRIDSLPTVASR